MLKQFNYNLSIDSPRLMPHAGGLQVTGLDISLIYSGKDTPRIFLTNDGILEVQCLELDNAYIILHSFVCEYHLPANYSIVYSHKLLATEKQFYELIKNWKIKPSEFEFVSECDLSNVKQDIKEDVKYTLSLENLENAIKISAEKREDLMELFFKPIEF